MALPTIDLSGLEPPLAIRPDTRMTDDELICFSERNKPYRFERNKEGEIIVMSPVGGIGGTHEIHVASMLYAWTEQTGTGISFGPNTGFNLPDGSCLSPDAARLSLERWNALTPQQQAGFPPSCPSSSSRFAPAATVATSSKPRCSFGWRTERNWRGWSTRLRAMSSSTRPTTRLRSSTGQNFSPAPGQ